MTQVSVDVRRLDDSELDTVSGGMYNDGSYHGCDEGIRPSYIACDGPNPYVAAFLRGVEIGYNKGK
jgi:hypothetical protein